MTTSNDDDLDFDTDFSQQSYPSESDILVLYAVTGKFIYFHSEILTKIVTTDDLFQRATTITRDQSPLKKLIISD